MKRYAALLDLPITSEDSVMLRAMVGNMDGMIWQVHIQLTGDPGAEGMRDKTYDLVKDFSELTKSKHAMASHGWLGHSLALFSVGQLSALSGAALKLAAHAGNKTGATASMLGKLQSLSLVQRALEIERQRSRRGPQSGHRRGQDGRRRRYGSGRQSRRLGCGTVGRCLPAAVPRPGERSRKVRQSDALRVAQYGPDRDRLAYAGGSENTRCASGAGQHGDSDDK